MRTLTRLTLIALAVGLAPAARAETKIGIVDYQRAGMECDEGKAITAALKKEMEEKQKQLDAKQTEFQTLRADFDKQQALLNDQAKQAKVAELDKRAGELQQMYVQLQQELAAREQEASRGMSDRLNATVKEIADSEGIQVVVNKAAVVYSPPSLDITNEVIRKYNAKYPKKADADQAKPASAATPASAAPKPQAK